MDYAREKQHGQYDFQWMGEVLYVRWRGTFNKQAMCAYVDDLKRLVEESRLERWGRIVDLREWEGITPDALAQFYQMSNWLKTTQCVASAQVFSNGFFQMIAAKVADTLAPPNLMQLFDMNEAIAYMKESGLHMEGEIPGS